MKRIRIIVEGQTEREFVKELLLPFFLQFGIYDVQPICIRTIHNGRGGFVNYEHLKNDAKKLLASEKDDFIVSMFVDFFRCPELPNSNLYEVLTNHEEKVVEMEKQIDIDISDKRFIPYIQLHEFEALLYSSNKGFEYYFEENESNQTLQIINNYNNPEDINSSPENAPSKRLLKIKGDYDKVVEGNLIALEVGINDMLKKCPRFKEWIYKLVSLCQ